MDLSVFITEKASAQHVSKEAELSEHPTRIRARRLGLDTQYEAIVFMHKDCHVCRAEGFSARTRVLLRHGERQVIATLYHVTSDLIEHNEAALSESAWTRLGLTDGDQIIVTHPPAFDSLSHVGNRIYGQNLGEPSFHAIIKDVVNGQYSDIHLSSFLTACAVRPLIHKEILALTSAMTEVGERLSWPSGVVVDKHCSNHFAPFMPIRPANWLMPSTLPPQTATSSRSMKHDDDRRWDLAHSPR